MNASTSGSGSRCPGAGSGVRGPVVGVGLGVGTGAGAGAAIRTVTGRVARMPESTAAIVASPSPCDVTSPWPDTVATFVLSEVQVAARLSSETEPSEYRAVSANCTWVPRAVNDCVPASVTPVRLGAVRVVACGVAEVGVLVPSSLLHSLASATMIIASALLKLPANLRRVTYQVPSFLMCLPGAICSSSKAQQLSTILGARGEHHHNRLWVYGIL